MGKDNQPKHRQKLRDLNRTAARRAPFERILIVSEGKKTEPNYFDEIRIDCRLSTANIQVVPGAFGTEPLRVVEYAEELFLKGDRTRGIDARAFDRLIAIFDRDEHKTYHDALHMVDARNHKHKNDLGERIPFEAVASVPCFELWLLLHFEDLHAPIHRDDVFKRLRVHLPGYDKGQVGHWAKTKALLDTAIQRARVRVDATSAHDGNEPYTAIHELVLRLKQLKD